MRVDLPICWACLGLLAVAGCGPGGEPEPKAPRPVSALYLRQSDPSRLDRVAGSLASWKTEQLGFEVDGRVNFVAEQDTHVEGLMRDAEGKAIKEGTLLASLDETRYQLRVRSAEAQVTTATQERNAAQVELDKVLPAQLRASEAAARVSRTEMDRRKALLERQAVPQEEYERAVADFERATARVEAVVAQRQAKTAEVAALDARVEELNEAKAEAEWDVQQCSLRSPYPGQVADVHVIPGAYVERAQPVLTVQMMDPISVEIEVSPATTRRLNYLDVAPVHVTRADGSTCQISAFVYTIDPVADPETRTFTVTLLARNERLRTPVPKELEGQPVARAESLRPIMSRPLMETDLQVIDDRAIQEDKDGHYLWRVKNRELGSPTLGTDPRLLVDKVRVTLGDRRASFLGLWDFRELTVDEGQSVDIGKTVFAAAVSYPKDTDAATFSGDTMLLDLKRWLLRPGDLVSVDLKGGAAPPGFYVPASAILTSGSKSSIFAVDTAESGSVARRIEVEVRESVNTLRRIEAAGEPALTEGMQIALDGALFLTDGERINVAEKVEVRQ